MTKVEVLMDKIISSEFLSPSQTTYYNIHNCLQDTFKDFLHKLAIKPHTYAPIGIRNCV